MCACLVLIVVMLSSRSYHLWDMIMLSPLFIMDIASRYDWYNGFAQDIEIMKKNIVIRE